MPIFSSHSTSPPILIWQPGGGVPVGPVSNPPVYSQSGITRLVEGQAYIDVVFGSIQTDADWVLATCDVENTTDMDPLNIWPGIITERTAAGFRLQLNGMPDSGNYYLHWAVSGVNIVPTPATLYFLTGPTSGGFGLPATFTVALPPSTTLAVPVIVNPSDGNIVGTAGTFSPTFVTLTSNSRTATFTYTPSTYGARTISTTNSGPLFDPTGIVFTSMAATYTFSGPSVGTVGLPTTNFTVALPGGSSVSGTVVVTPHDGGGGGTFTPTTVNLTTGAPSATFTYTPASAGAKTLSVTNNGGLTDPGNLTCTIAAPFDPSTITGCKLWLKADSLALSDGASVTTWADQSGSSNDFTYLSGGSSIYKTAIVNGKPVVRFSSSFLKKTTASIVSSNYTIFAVANAASVVGIDPTIFATGAVGGGSGVMVRRGTNNLAHMHFDSAGFTYVNASEAAGIVAGAWNLITCDWDGSNIHLWRNGTLKATTATTTLGRTGTDSSIGYDWPNAANFWDGDIAEVLVYNNALGTTDRDNVTNYLRAKYGI